MALETLKDMAKIGGFDMHSDNDIANGKWADVDKKFSVCVHHGDNTLAFRLQDGPVKEFGVNGCQVDTVIHAARTILHGLNDQFPCRENSIAIRRLDEAIMWLEQRTKDREQRGVEGTSQH